MSKQSIYIHTLNGKPASYNGQQVCYAFRGGKVAHSLAQIRREQAASQAYRDRRGFSDYGKLGYARFTVEL